jgi:hypothetical protein
MARVAAGLAEAQVGGGEAAAADVRQHAVEHHPAVQILVEAEIQELAQEAAALRLAIGIGVTDRVVAARGQRVGSTGVAAQPGSSIERPMPRSCLPSGARSRDRCRLRMEYTM